MLTSLLDHPAATAAPILPSSDDCRGALAGFDAIPSNSLQRFSPLRRVLGPAPDYFVSVAPGMVRVGRKRAEGWELVDQAAERDAADRIAGAGAELREALEHYGGDFGSLPLGVVAGCDPGYVVEAYEDWLLNVRAVVEQRRGRLRDSRFDFDALVRARPPRGRVKWWSRKSRANLVRTAASLDFAPLNRPGVCSPVMVTLTYPGNWHAVCPDAATLKRHLRAFRAAFDRKWGDELGGARGIWKMEFQERGAPHVHALLPAPIGRRREYRAWCLSTWARIVGARGEDRRRHEAAGTRVDWEEGGRMSDPRRIATYFAKHAAPNATSSKEYQHLPPVEWLVDQPLHGPWLPVEGVHGPFTAEHPAPVHAPPATVADGASVGRWWGVWGLERVDERVCLTRDDAVDVRRLLRSWKRASSRRYVMDPHQAGHVELGQAELRGYRRRRIDNVPRSFTMSDPCGFVVANDGPALARSIARSLQVEPDWPPGRRRPLP